jgi:hypothetical protein
LPGGAEQDNFGVLQQRLEVRHGADAQKNQQRKNLGTHSRVVEETDKSAFHHHFRQRNIDQNGAKADRNQKQRLVTLVDPKVEEQTADRDHDDMTRADI